MERLQEVRAEMNSESGGGPRADREGILGWRKRQHRMAGSTENCKKYGI